MLWTPENPHIYRFTLETDTDKIESYFALREVGIDEFDGVKRITLNGEPYVFNGLLDQGYWSDGMYTAPSDEALIYDIQTMKDLGFNTLRKHIKIEPLRWYYHCDRLGMIVWQDMPNGGGDYNMIFVTYLTNAFDWFARGVRDNLYGMFKRQDKEGRAQYYRDLEAMIEQLYNYPSIAVWVPFNEGWGQFESDHMYDYVKGLDSTRLADSTSGWFAQDKNDFDSEHIYFKAIPVEPNERPMFMSECGGYSMAVEDHYYSKYNVYGYGGRTFRSNSAIFFYCSGWYYSQYGSWDFVF